MTPPSTPAIEGLQKARAIVGALLADDDETYAQLVGEAVDADDVEAKAIIGSLAGLLAGNVYMLAESRGVDPLQFWLDAVERSMEKGV